MKNETTDLDHNKIGRTTLFKFVFPSLTLILFVPLLINSIFQLFNKANYDVSQIYLGYYEEIVQFDKSTIIVSIVQIIALILGIYKNGSKASKLILDKQKWPFFIGFKTVLILWAWIFISAMLASGILNSISHPNSGLFFKTLVYWLILPSLYYISFAILHSLSIGYFIGRRIKTFGERRFV